MIAPRRYGVCGNPIRHSRSPCLHSTFARQTQRNLVYAAYRVEEEAFDRFVRRFFAEGGCGLNVTVPHKARALAIADEASGFAQRTQAANVLSRRQDKIVAYNTDGGGFIRDLLRHFPDGIGDKQILLMGAGGAARAVACAIADEQPAAFYLSNRTRQKAEALAEMTGATVIPDVATMDRPLDIIVNASAAGHEGKGMPFPPNCRSALAYDLSYGAAAQPFIRQALDGGAARAVDGSGMLAWQAALSFALWEGILPTVSPLL